MKSVVGLVGLMEGVATAARPGYEFLTDVAQNCFQKWSQNGPKMVPKLLQNGPKMVPFSTKKGIQALGTPWPVDP